MFNEGAIVSSCFCASFSVVSRFHQAYGERLALSFPLTSRVAFSPANLNSVSVLWGCQD